MSEFYTKHYYLINGKDRLSGDSVSFYSKNHFYNKVISFSVKEILIPYTFYPINSTNNTIVYTVFGLAPIKTATIPPGNYTLAQFKIALKAALEFDEVRTYTITDNPTTNKLTITQNTGSFAIYSTGTLNKIIGFSTTTDTDLAIAHTGINVYNLSGTNRIKIYSNELTKFDTRVKSSGVGDGGLLFSFNISDSSFGQNIFRHYEHMSYDYHAHSENSIDIVLKDEDNNILGGTTGLNGQEIQLVLQFHTTATNDDNAMRKSDSRQY